MTEGASVSPWVFSMGSSSFPNTVAWILSLWSPGPWVLPHLFRESGVRSPGFLLPVLQPGNSQSSRLGVSQGLPHLLPVLRGPLVSLLLLLQLGG